MSVIRKIGQSKGLIIPKNCLDTLGFEEGTPVTIRVIGDELVIKRARKKYTLDELVSRMSPEHNTPELITGEVGDEISEYEPKKTKIINEKKPASKE